MSKIRLAVLDVLKPHKPDIIEMGREIEKSARVSVNLRISEKDEKTETLQVIIKGKDIDIDKVRQALESMGASIHSVDEVSVGPELINSKDYAMLPR